MNGTARFVIILEDLYYIKMDLNSKITNKAALIWAIADKITGVYKPHEYGKVILPLTVIKRFDSILEETKSDVLAAFEKCRNMDNDIMRNEILTKASGHPFYNTSKYTLRTLLDDPDHIDDNFASYINAFSPNVCEIIEKFEFAKDELPKMREYGLLFTVLQEFGTDKADMHPSRVSDIEMGYIFEELIRKFSESYNEEAGQHYTPREVIELMVHILLNFDNAMLSSKQARTIYDPACGTGGMLSIASEYIKKHNSSAAFLCFGQEINPETYAIAKADMLIKGENDSLIRSGNTLSDDQFPNQTFNYIISNPPFGREWKKEKASVEKEAKLTRENGGRFFMGLPAIGDSQMLFLSNAVAKMKPVEEGGSRVAIVHNGSPLFTGDAGSGPSDIRKYLLENDLLEAIIALPNDIFYNTGIATYIWVLSNNKENRRMGKVQLINANGLYEKRRKSLGNKRNDIPQTAIDEIAKIYGDFRENKLSKIFKNEDFGYRKVVVERPLRDESGKPILKKGKVQADPKLRDTENIPLSEDVAEYMKREVLPYAPDAWIDESKTKIGYEIPFTRYFYEYTPPVPSEEIKREILQIESELRGSIERIFE
mgnify:FL=1